MKIISACVLNMACMTAIASTLPQDLVMVPEQYREDIAPMIGLLKEQNPRCKQYLNPLNVATSSQQDNPANPQFFAQCGEGSQIEVVRFTWMDAVNLQMPHVEKPEAITQAAAADTCEKRASEAHGAVNFSRLMHSGFRVNSDGSSLYQTQFSTKNALGVDRKFNIRCHFKGVNLSEVRITPS